MTDATDVVDDVDDPYGGHQEDHTVAAERIEALVMAVVPTCSGRSRTSRPDPAERRVRRPPNGRGVRVRGDRRGPTLGGWSSDADGATRTWGATVAWNDAVEGARRGVRSHGGRLARLVEEIGDVRERAAGDRITIVAAGLSYYLVLAAIPALVATVAIYTWVSDAASLVRRLEMWTTSFPDEIQRLVVGQLLEIAGMAGTGAGLSFVVSVLITFWSASKAGRALMQALNIVHDAEEGRQTARRRAIAVAVAIAGVVGAVIALGIFNAGSERAGGWWSTVTTIAFWPGLLLAVGVLAALAYRFAPSRPAVSLPETVPGALLTVVVFGVATAAMLVYVATIGVGRAYGALGAFVAGGLWLLAVCWALLFGAYLNEELAESTTDPGTRGRGRSEG